jgi:hypothetical protein
MGIGGCSTMSPKREIKARDFVADLRSGLSDRDLMEKYELTVKDLEVVFRKLIQAKAIGPSERKGTSAQPDDTPYPEMPSDFRISVREQLDFPLPVYEKDFPETRGLVRDVSATGVGTKGIEVEVGDVKILIIPAHELFHVNPVEVEAKCCWSKEEGIHGDCIAGFEIVNVLEGSLEDLQMMIRSIPLEDRVAMRKKI